VLPRGTTTLPSNSKVNVNFMASAKASPEIRKEIEALFSWNPPRLAPAPSPSDKNSSTKNSSTGTTFYDKHVSAKLILRQVYYLPSLVQDLAKNVDTAVLAASETLPPLKGFITAQQRETYINNLDTIVTDENEVASFYGLTTARFCSPLASTLALHPKASFSQWRSLLLWTRSGPTSSYPTCMDGWLRFLKGGSNENIESLRASIVETMESETRRIFEELRESFSPMGTWEMKSISVGSREVMTAVPNLGKFSWMTCTDDRCLTIPKRQNEREKVEYTVVGPDAKAPPWNLNVRSFSHNRDSVF
jgi:hypothetical protein